MIAIIDERYAFLASEEKWNKKSELLQLALTSRPKAYDIDKDRLCNIYGVDILTIALLGDSPLSSPLAKNFDGALEGAWRLLNKLWGLRLKAFSYEKQSIEENILTMDYHKQIAKIHSLTNNIEKNFNNNIYWEILSILYKFAPNFCDEVQEYLRKK